MDNLFLPHDQFYTAEPAVVKKRQDPIADKIYTYKATPNAVFVKRRPIFNDPAVNYGNSGVGSKKNREYEYLNEIKRLVENQKEALYAEQIREVILNDIRLNQYNKEQLQLVALQNYFKDGLFSFLSNQVKDFYIQNQAKKLMRNDNELRDLSNNIADIRNANLTNVNMVNDITNIKKELKSLDDDISSEAENLLESGKEDLTDDMKNRLQQMLIKKSIDENFGQEEKTEILNEIQNKDIPTLLQDIENLKREAGLKTETLDKTIQDIEKTLGERRKQKEDMTKIIKPELQRIQEEKVDLKTKISRQRGFNRELLKKMLTDEKKYLQLEEFNYPAKDLTKKAKRDLDKLFKLDLLSEQDYATLKSNFPDLKRATAAERRYITTNVNQLLNGIVKGQYVSADKFIDAIKTEGAYTQLDKKYQQPKYSSETFEEFKRLLNENLKEEILDKSLEQRNSLYLDTKDLFEDVANQLGINILPTNLPIQQAPTTEAPTTEVSTPFEEEGPAPQPVENPLLNDFNTLITNINTQYNTNYPELDTFDLKEITEPLQLQNLSNSEILEATRQALNFMVLNNEPFEKLPGFINELISDVEGTTEEGEAFYQPPRPRETTQELPEPQEIETRVATPPPVYFFETFETEMPQMERAQEGQAPQQPVPDVVAQETLPQFRLIREEDLTPENTMLNIRDRLMLYINDFNGQGLNIPTDWVENIEPGFIQAIRERFNVDTIEFVHRFIDAFTQLAANNELNDYDIDDFSNVGFYRLLYNQMRLRLDEYRAPNLNELNERRLREWSSRRREPSRNVVIQSPDEVSLGKRM